MEWLSKRKNAALLCFGCGGLLALLLIIYAPVRMTSVVLDGGELQQMAFMCAAPEKLEEFVYVKDAQVCAEMESVIQDISLQRVRRAVYVMIREPIYTVKPTLKTGGTTEGFIVDSNGSVYSGRVQYRAVHQEDGLALYKTVAELWQQVKK